VLKKFVLKTYLPINIHMSSLYKIALKRIEELKPGKPDIPPKQVLSTVGMQYDEIKRRDMKELERVWLPNALVELYKEKLKRWGLPLKRHILERVHMLYEAELENYLDDGRTLNERMKILYAETCLEDIKDWKVIPKVDGEFSLNGKRPFVYFINEPTEVFAYPGIYIIPKREEDLKKMPDYAGTYDIGMAFAYWEIRDGMLRISVLQSDVYSHIPAGIRKHYRHWPDAIFGIAAMVAKDYKENYVGIVPAFLPLNLWPRLSVSTAHFVYSYKPSKYFEFDLESGLWAAKPDEILERTKNQETAIHSF